MKFGFSVFPYDMYGSLHELAEVVVRADELGFDFATFPEHVVPTPEVSAQLGNRNWPDFPTLAAFLAAKTRKIEFCTNICILPLANPFRLARQLATLDQVSDGRVVLGIGIGWEPREFAALKVPFAERAAIAGEYVAAMRALWSSEPASFSGRYVHFENVSFLPKPVRGAVRIFSGNVATEKAFERTAKTYDGWLPWKVARDDLPSAMAQLRAALARNGRSLGEFDVTWRPSLGVNPANLKAWRHVTAGAPRKVQLEKSFAQDVQELAALGVTRASVSFPSESPKELTAALERFASDHISPAKRAR